MLAVIYHVSGMLTQVYVLQLLCDVMAATLLE